MMRRHIEHCARVSDLKVERLKALAVLVESCAPLEGDFVEVGVWRGGSARLICAIAPNKLVHLFDTFKGLPQPTHKGDKHRRGDWSDTSVDVVMATLGDLENYRIYEGEFPASLPPVFQDKLAFVHMDTDLYAPTKAALELLWPRLVRNGVMLFDDFDAPLCAGVKTAVREWLKSCGSESEFSQHGIACALRKL